ncbi:TRIC cation channel family protein [Microbacterium sp. zg.B48]|uniref:trimeric intracellular cation channel family protein n=1 Tax=unclassified Microbacterium TaxID=2609290 RepID=UPI00214CD837|nr:MULTISPECIES: TRIC cation channel family protein [unclassified Microbacterium]MCR2764823.1 TRIC cation channel family protein [Microbacterium sp. zg.B48]MCR2810040.1 TRIC cation channel family protein [Microbacterium sp. zg.B185]WIM20120.1 TRIC cation channel family protein [Microbacterium sp. zg-B185]
MDTVLDFLGTFFFAISGSLLAAHRGFDIVGSVLLGLLTGLGGGVIRDLILGVTPAAFSQPVYLLAPLAAAALVFFLYTVVERLPRTLLIFDAAGLGLFCTTGAAKALELGMNPVAAALLGVATGVGGGLLRDVVANRDPELFDPNDIYAVPAMMGAALVAAAWMVGWYDPLIQLAVGVFVFAFRLASLRFHWHVPHAVARWGHRS